SIKPFELQIKNKIQTKSTQTGTFIHHKCFVALMKSHALGIAACLCEPVNFVRRVSYFLFVRTKNNQHNSVQRKKQHFSNTKKSSS
ncbi:hypothetical protein AB1K40_18100, partial [Vibrio cholerae]|uniref:hypothetical protein n=3 Tax=Vibrio cholerae TaxID=666 RepID=UPI0034584EDD